MPVRSATIDHRDRKVAQLGALAVESLLDEARLSPKPGLVDSRGNGAHSDLTLALMCRSAISLEPSFVQMAQAGRLAAAPTPALREALGLLGRQAEATMLACTGGVNTHRGAIWALGLLVAAAALQEDESGPDTAAPIAGALAARVAAHAAAVARHADRHAPAATGHKGEQACRDFNVAGARGQAQAGFPHVMDHGLPELRRSRARGDSETASRLNALLAIMSRLDDTCVLARGGLHALRRMQAAAAKVLAIGGAATLAGRRAMRELGTLAIESNVSPGGAADLLAATLFLDRFEGMSAQRRAHHLARRSHGEA
jgi:triphosphoribosyl-dephospho-CoA synthase